MTIEQMRSEISLAYPGPTWQSRVSRMGDSQVCAVYHRLSTTGKLDEALKERKSCVQQISFFDKEYAAV